MTDMRSNRDRDKGVSVEGNDRSMVTVDLSRDGRPERLIVKPAELRVVAGPDEGLQATIGVESVLVGTHSSCDMVLTDPTVSARHLEIVMRTGGYLLRDLGSRNGVLVGGWRVEQVYLAPGMTLDVGKSKIQVIQTPEVTEVRLSTAERFGEVLGRSLGMRRIFAILESVARTDTTVLFEGETGTGKGLLAEAVHSESHRARGPFEVFDCSAVAPALIESELFGHERGAFTGAAESRAGAFERAVGGTLLIDEVGELPLELQPKLLRAVDSKRIRRIGSTRPHDIDLRLVAATNKKLDREVASGRFRRDLFFRLAVVRISVPPLRERIEDLPLLLQQLSSSPFEGQQDLQDELPGLLPLLSSYDWPGNVRELRNFVERVQLLPPNEALPTEIRPAAAASAETLKTYSAAREAALDQFERAFLRRVLEHTRGNVSDAAKVAGISRRYLTRLIAKHQVDRQRRPGDLHDL